MSPVAAIDAPGVRMVRREGFSASFRPLRQRPPYSLVKRGSRRSALAAIPSAKSNDERSLSCCAHS